LSCVAPEIRSEKPTNATDAISAAVTPLHTRFSAVMLLFYLSTVESLQELKRQRLLRTIDLC
jgi:hypothetical protein